MRHIIKKVLKEEVEKKMNRHSPTHPTLPHSTSPLSCRAVSQLEFLSESDDQIFVGAKMLDLGFHREPRVRNGQEEGAQARARVSTCFKGLAQNFVLTCADEHERDGAMQVRCVM